ncbi:MAG: hypothetical protein HN742_23725 [Lentisphaerae bacterium]|jgi:hypothetical protein|nr:hypothetical protein [Lentisphaerota bacterium]MBT5607604.1 hypothetical protein [Lentisphaerota bacterium]MBT7059828.1 hypothetical protein [Lentisphaerota bacterium]MBT7844906.1 hypothetical protein [Lentisphaerota bacterium]
MAREIGIRTTGWTLTGNAAAFRQVTRTFSKTMKLPSSMLECADRSTNEEAWRIGDFAEILDRATENGLVCVGGQFQFRGPIGIAEMYWLNADSSPRRENETWQEYVLRANAEVRSAFDRLVAETDFGAEARGWSHIQKALATGTIGDPKDHLYFVAYFGDETTGAEQSRCT